MTKMLTDNDLPHNPVHPGEILRHEFLEELDISQSALARHIGVPPHRINEICNGKRGITPETAWLLSQAFGTTAQFWMNLQSTFDLVKGKTKRKIGRIVAAL